LTIFAVVSANIQNIVELLWIMNMPPHTFLSEGGYGLIGAVLADEAPL
jgi:hypothetical protein